jgi:hypothetical protein
MTTRKCPKCGRSCEISEENLQLGVLIKCICGCSFDVLPALPPTYRLRAQESEVKRPPPEPPRVVRKKTPLRTGLFHACAVLASFVAIYILWRWDWSRLLFLTSVGLTLFYWWKKRNWKARDNKSLSFLLFDRSLDKVAETLSKGPQQVEEVVTSEADRIVNSVQIRGITPTGLDQVKTSVATVEQNLRNIDVTTKVLGERMNEAATTQALRPPPGQESPSAAAPPGSVGTCKCFCGPRLMWGPVPIFYRGQCIVLCPPLPCR